MRLPRMRLGESMGPSGAGSKLVRSALRDSELLGSRRLYVS